MIIYTVYNFIMWLNALPILSGVPGGFSPRELMTGMNLNFIRDCNIDCGVYVEASTDVIITNDNSEGTHSCIALGPSGNRQGSIN